MLISIYNYTSIVDIVLIGFQKINSSPGHFVIENASIYNYTSIVDIVLIGFQEINTFPGHLVVENASIYL